MKQAKNSITRANDT